MASFCVSEVKLQLEVENVRSQVAGRGCAVLAEMCPEIIYNEWRISWLHLTGHNIKRKMEMFILPISLQPWHSVLLLSCGLIPDQSRSEVWLCSVPGLSLHTSGQSRKRKGAAENIPESFPDGEHDPAPDEPELLLDGKLKQQTGRTLCVKVPLYGCNNGLY